MAKKQPGKIITTFRYRKGGNDIELALRLVKRSQIEDTSYHSYGDELAYLVHLDEPPLHVTGLDAEKVRKDALAKLDELCAITWERKIVIHFQLSDCSYNGNSAKQSRGLDFHWSYYDFGVTVNGKHVRYELDSKLTRQRGEPSWGWPTEDQDGKPIDEVKGEWFGANERERIVAISYSPENVAKVEMIRDAVELLGQRMFDLFSQKNLANTMANIKSLVLPFKAQE